MKIFLQSIDSDHRIQIDVIENPPLTRWITQCKKLQEIRPIKGTLNLNNVYYPIIPTGDELALYTELTAAIDRLKILLAEKNVIDFNFPELPSKFNRDQHWCNDVHNIFVSLNFFLKKHYPDYWVELPSWENTVFETAKEINVIIHKLEKWARPTENQQYVKNTKHGYFQTCIDLSYHKMNLWFSLSQEEQDLYHSTYESNQFYDVVFSNEILGKTYYRSFIDEEPINSPAISGIDNTWGNLDIKLDQQRELIFKDPRFQTWVETVNHNKQSAPLEFPVGTINPSSDLDYFIKRKTTEVVFQFEN